MPGRSRSSAYSPSTAGGSVGRDRRLVADRVPRGAARRLHRGGAPASQAVSRPVSRSARTEGRQAGTPPACAMPRRPAARPDQRATRGPSTRVNQPEEQTDRRGLAGPVWPEKAEDFAPFNAEVEANERVKRAAICLGQPVCHIAGASDIGRSYLRTARLRAPGTGLNVASVGSARQFSGSCVSADSQSPPAGTLAIWSIATGSSMYRAG